jgi:PAS domain S-box-containing protein
VRALKLIRIRDVNREAVLQSGAKSKEQLLAGLPQIFTDGTMQVFTEELVQLWEGRRSIELESYSRRFDGKEADLVMRIQVPGPDAAPDWERVIVTGTDITERKRAERRLSGRKKILEAIAQHRPLEEILTLLIRTVEEESDVVGSVLLLEPGGMYLEHAAAPSLPEAYVAGIARVPLGPTAGSCGTAAFLDKPVFVADVSSDPLWRDYYHLIEPYELRACWSAPIHARDGRVLGTFAMYSREVRDPDQESWDLLLDALHLSSVAIERQRAFDELERSERQFRETLENVRLIAIGLDREGKVTFANKYLLELTGWTEKEVLGCNWFDQFLRCDGDAKTQFERDVAEDVVSLHHETEILTRGGRRRTVRWNTTAVRDLGGRVVGTYSLGEDITDRLRLEEQLRQSQKMEAVGRLAGGVAHDFNNFLTVINGYAGLALEEASESAVRDSLAAIEDAGVRAAGLTRQLLAFSRKQVLSPQVLDLGAQIAGILPIVERILGSNVRLEVSLAPDLRPVRADSSQIEQVLMNLVVNARDAMPSGGSLALITQNVRGETPVDDRVRLTVRDNGLGMDEATRAHIFEPFFTTKAAENGTGLGLATVYGIVVQSGGRIEVDSEPGRGTAFHIDLPPAIKSTNGDDAPHPVAPRTVATSGKEAILLVEDERAVRTFVRLALERQGYNVLEAEDGADALDVSEHAGRIDILISDIMMPSMTGPDLASRMLAKRPDMKVLLISAYPKETLDDRGQLPAGFAYLQKPFSPDDLARKVREALDADGC